MAGGGVKNDLEDEIQRLVLFVEEQTSLRSRWNGRVIILDEAEMQMLHRRRVLGEKRWNCSILVHASLQDNPLRWRTLLHEVLHSISAGVNEQDYRRFRGWEEGVVEWLQRHMRPGALRALDISLTEEAFALAERTWPLNGYLEALQVLQEAAVREAEVFYLDLLRMPLRERPAAVRSWGTDTRFLELFARTIGKLR